MPSTSVPSTIDLTTLEPTVSLPAPAGEHPTWLRSGEDIKIDQVVIGSCTNGRMEDMRGRLRGAEGQAGGQGRARHHHPRHHGRVSRSACSAGYTGGVHRCRLPSSPPPPAAPAWAATWAFWRQGERCVSTTNRNFVGRMGHVDSEVYLASPAIAAASALAGLHHRSEGGVKP